MILLCHDGVTQPTCASILTSDVSRRSEVCLHVYIRTSIDDHDLPDRPNDIKAIIGKNDLYLGSVVFVPSFENQRPSDSWYPMNTGHGQLHVGVAFKQQSGKSLSIESFELLKVIGKGSFGKVMQVRKRDTARIYALKTIRKAHICLLYTSDAADE